MLKPQSAKLLDGRDLSTEEAEAAMGTIMRGDATPAQIGGYLVALRMNWAVGLQQSISRRSASMLRVN